MPVICYILLEDISDIFVKGCLLNRICRHGEKSHSYDMHLQVGCSKQVAVEEWKVTALYESDYKYLRNIGDSCDLYKVFTHPTKLRWAKWLKPGDKVFAHLRRGAACSGVATPVFIQTVGPTKIGFKFKVKSCYAASGASEVSDHLDLDRLEPYPTCPPSPPAEEATDDESVPLPVEKDDSQEVLKLRKTCEELQKQLWSERAESEAKLNHELKEKDKERERSLLQLTDYLQEELADEIAHYQQEIKVLCDSKKNIVDHYKQEIEALRDSKRDMEDRYQREIKDLKKDIEDCHQQVWEVDRKDVELTREIIGTGGWGKVVKGNFRGINVAVKQLHSHIVSDYNEEMVKREIGIMARIRHPNLLLFIGAIIVTNVRSEGESSLIIMELLDTSLRVAYQQNRVSANSKKPILCDVACALAYLHTNRVPIIHRDVSSSNVLLQAVSGSCQWKAKLSDFGSANILSKAVTPNAGAVIYAAPETISEHIHPQTTKVDVYSFGVLVCEVALFQPPPDERKDFTKMLSQVQTRNKDLFNIAKDCTKRSQEKRPSMTIILKLLQ